MRRMTNPEPCTHPNPVRTGVGSSSVNGGPERSVGRCPDCNVDMVLTVSTGQWHEVESDDDE